jgi:hypothetical protein
MHDEMNERESLLEGIKIWAKVGVELGESVKKANKLNEQLWRKLQFGTPIRTWQVASGTFPSSGTLTLKLGSPDSGTYWNLRSFAVGGADVNVPAVGKFGLYVSGFVSTTSSPGLTALIDGGNPSQDTMPYTQNYGNDSFRINDQETIQVVIYGGTPGQLYSCNMGALVYNSAAALGNDINQG